MRIVKRGLLGAVIGIAATVVATRVAPQFAEPIGQIAAATQGVEGVIGKVALEQFVPQIRNILGQGNGNGQAPGQSV